MKINKNEIERIKNENSFCRQLCNMLKRSTLIYVYLLMMINNVNIVASNFKVPNIIHLK